MTVLVDTSVWIDYFRRDQQSAELRFFIIAQNAKANHCEVFSLDQHFQMLTQVINIKLYQLSG